MSSTLLQDENLVDESFPLRLNVDKKEHEPSHIDLNLIQTTSNYISLIRR